MANSLGRDIEAGEVLVVRSSKVQLRFKDINRRLFVARAGFGMNQAAAGGAVMGDEYSFLEGQYVYEGRGRWEGQDFSKLETAEWQAAHGKFLPADQAAAAAK
jgi:hypothetical protein